MLNPCHEVNKTMGINIQGSSNKENVLFRNLSYSF